MNRELCDELLADERLPSPNAVALEVMRLADDPDTDGAELAAVVARDPAIASRLLRIANAGATGNRGAVSSVQQAVRMLGFGAVARIAIVVSVLEQNRTGRAEFDYERYWHESLAAAVGARTLAYYLKMSPADAAFTCGLLCRIGRLALVTLRPAMYRGVCRAVAEGEHADLAAAEAAVFGIDAEALSAFMMREWGMPHYDRVLGRLRGGESAAAVPAKTLVGICRVARRIAKVLLEWNVKRDQLTAVMGDLSALGLPPDSFSGLFAIIAESFCEEGRILDVTVPGLHSLEELCACAIGPA
jgi:HD-like signal output (HDOD) protein